MDYTNPKEHFCSNKSCRDYNKIGANNIIRRGHNKKGKQMFMCKTCGVRFVETKGTVFYNRHLSEEDIILICKLLVEKNSIRAIERITGHHRDTIRDLMSDLAAHCREVTDFLVKNVGLTLVQVDEMWSFIKKSKRTLTKEMRREMKKATAGYT